MMRGLPCAPGGIAAGIAASYTVGGPHEPTGAQRDDQPLHLLELRLPVERRVGLRLR